jgi:hypothetical protein
MSDSAEHMLNGGVRATEDGVQIPEWLRQLDWESRQRQRRVIVRIDADDDMPEPPPSSERDPRR